MLFEEFQLPAAVLKAVLHKGYTTPTPVQEKAIPAIRTGRDLSISAQTGTGKTAAFILPALERLSTPSTMENSKGPRVLILVPTRELAIQVAAEAEEYCKFMAKTSIVCIYGGAPYPIQNRQLSRYVDILVATPGRLIDHLERGRIDFSRLEMLILDEADRMLDMGFIEPVEQIAEATPATRQTLMFSATFSPNVLKLSKRLQKDPSEIALSHSHDKHENIEQCLYYVDNIGHKHRLLTHILKDESMKQAIVFTSTKMQADELCQRLSDEGFETEALHGDMNQRQRTRTINQFRQEKFRFLIATDVAARGIDVLTVSHVINFDIPNCAEDYVHRIGRTGRAGGKGFALSFAAPRDTRLIRAIEIFTGRKIEPATIAGMEPSSKTSFAPNSAPSRSGGRPAPARYGSGRGRSSGSSYGGNSDSSGNSAPRSSGYSNESGSSYSKAPRSSGYGNESGSSYSKAPRSSGYGNNSGSSYNSAPKSSGYGNKPAGGYNSKPAAGGGGFKPAYKSTKPRFGSGAGAGAGKPRYRDDS